MTKPDEKKKPVDKDEEKEKEVEEKDKGKPQEDVFDDSFEDEPKKE